MLASITLRHPGHSSLHLAAERDNAAIVTALLAAGASPDLVSQDTTKCDAPLLAGGMLPLHCAAAAGASTAARLLLDAHPEGAIALDWDGHLPAQIALQCGHIALAQSLAQAAEAALATASGGQVDDAEAAELVREVCADLEAAAADGAASLSRGREAAALRRLGQQEREKCRLWIGDRPLLRTAHLLQREWSVSECDWLLAEVGEAASLHGWQGKRHKHYATEDIPLWRLGAKAAAWVRERVSTTIFPAMSAAFGMASTDLRLQECFVVRYEPTGQSSLSMHRDETLLSFNIALNDGYDGGGTCFAQPAALHVWEGGSKSLINGESTRREEREASVVRSDRGDCLVHCGQLLHGGATVTGGTRMILVGFVSEVVRSERRRR